MKKIAVYLINKYQKISKYTPKVCRYYPSCSEYTKQAIIQYGFLKGCYMGIKRILRCNPFFDGGYDPIDNGGNK